MQQTGCCTRKQLTIHCKLSNQATTDQFLNRQQQRLHYSFNEILQRIIQLFFRIVYHNSPRHQYQPGPLVDICRLLPIIPAFCTQFVKKKKKKKKILPPNCLFVNLS